MENTTLLPVRSTVPPRASAPPGLLRRQAALAAWWGVAIGLAVPAGLLAWRRLAGELTAPPSVRLLLLMAVLLALAVAAARGLRAAVLPADADPRPELRSRLVLTAAVVCLAAVSLPGMHPLGLLVAWIVLLLPEWIAWWNGPLKPSSVETAAEVHAPGGWRVWLDQLTRIDSPHPMSPVPETPVPEPPAAEAAPSAIPEAAPPPDSLAGGDCLTRQTFRGYDPQGRQVCGGWVRLEFAPRQRSEVAHVEFCPPFARLPQMTVRASSGGGDQVKPVQLLRHGAVIEVRLAQRFEEPSARRIEFRAVEPAEEPSANRE